MKTILSVQEQIRHMKEKGITFQHVTEAEAADFLANNTYYMRRVREPDSIEILILDI